MTRNRSLPAEAAASVPRAAKSSSPLRATGVVVAESNQWPLQDAKTHFSELVRRVKAQGPQHVTVHGHEAVVVIDAASYRRLTSTQSGQALVDALGTSPHRGVDLAPARKRMPVRVVRL